LRVPAAKHPGRRNEKGLPGRYPVERARLDQAGEAPRESEAVLHKR